MQSLGGLEFASGVSADGSTVVGRAEQSAGPPEAVVATIPGAIGASPALSINSSPSTANQFVLSWSTNYTGFMLQYSGDLASTNWTNCANPATVSGAYFLITNPMAGGAQQFFRLISK